MRRAVLYSAALHVTVFTVAWFGVPALFSTPETEDQPIAVELVSIEDLAKKQPAPQPPKPEPPPAAKPAPPPPPPPATTPPAPPPRAELVPEPPPPPKAKPKPEPKPAPKPVAKPEPKPPVKTAAAAPKPRRKPERPDQFQALLKNLAKQQAERQRRQKKKPEAKPEPQPAPPQRVAAVSPIDRRATERRLTAEIKRQVALCWNIPGGAKDAQNMKVGVQIRLNADGSLRGAPHVLDTARMRNDRAFRAVAESAVRALLNPRCSPLNLPYDEYDIWKSITFNFDPSEALGP